MSDAINKDAAIDAENIATANQIFAHVLCLTLFFIKYYFINGSIARSFILHSVIMSISRL